jgi:hypothetical protein
VDVFQAAAGRKRLKPQRRQQPGAVKRRMLGAVKITTQRISTAAGVGISGSSDLCKRRGLRSGGVAPTRRKRAEHRIWRRLVGYRGGDVLARRSSGAANTCVEEEEGEGAARPENRCTGAGEGDMAVNGSLMSDDVRTSRLRPTVASTMMRPMCANGTGMQQPLELNFLSLTLISWWRMQFGEWVFKKCSFP